MSINLLDFENGNNSQLSLFINWFINSIRDPEGPSFMFWFDSMIVSRFM